MLRPPPLAVPSCARKLLSCTLAVDLSGPHHRVGGVEDVEEALADGLGQDVVLGAQNPGPDPAQSQEHGQRGAHAEEVLHLFGISQSRRHLAGNHDQGTALLILFTGRPFLVRRSVWLRIVPRSSQRYEGSVSHRPGSNVWCPY